jgi:hypothetical protein
MIGEIPYMLVWGFFSAMGWMTANYTVDKIFPDKPKEPVSVVQTEKKDDKKEETSVKISQ